jgi:hypothetical protein
MFSRAHEGFMAGGGPRPNIPNGPHNWLRRLDARVCHAVAVDTLPRLGLVPQAAGSQKKCPSASTRPIEHAAIRSLNTGQRYRVQCGDAAPRASQAWLMARLRRMRAVGPGQAVPDRPRPGSACKAPALRD